MKIKEGRIPLYFQLYRLIKNDINLKEILPALDPKSK